MGLVLALVEEIVDGIAVGQDDSIVAPLIAQDIDEQTVAGATGLTLETLIGTHHLAHITFFNQCLKGRQIGFPEVAVSWLNIHGVAQRLWTAMHGIVLGTGVSLKILVVVALHTQYRLHT